MQQLYFIILCVSLCLWKNCIKNVIVSWQMILYIYMNTFEHNGSNIFEATRSLNALCPHKSYFIAFVIYTYLLFRGSYYIQLFIYFIKRNGAHKRIKRYIYIYKYHMVLWCNAAHRNGRDGVNLKSTVVKMQLGGKTQASKLYTHTHTQNRMKT